MTHQSESTLAAAIDEAARSIHIGQLYAHYKQPDLHYKILLLSIEEATGRVLVIYQAQYGPRVTWSRSAVQWLEPALVNGRLIPRYHKV